MLFYETLEPASASTPEHRLPVDIKCKWLQNVALLKLETVKASQPHKKTLQKTSCAKNLIAYSVKPHQPADFGGAPKSTGHSPLEKEDDYISQCQ